MQNSNGGNEFLNQLKATFPSYITILVQNEDYILAVPPARLFNKVNIDDILITEHILELSYDGKELTSLNGKTYQIEGGKRLKSTDNPDF